MLNHPHTLSAGYDCSWCNQYIVNADLLSSHICDTVVCVDTGHVLVAWAYAGAGH